MFLFTSRSLTTEYNLELVYRKPFLDIWHEEKDDPELGPLSERMGVRARGQGELLVTDEELDAASEYICMTFEKLVTDAFRFLSCFRFSEGVSLSISSEKTVMYFIMCIMYSIEV